MTSNVCESFGVDVFLALSNVFECFDVESLVALSNAIGCWDELEYGISLDDVRFIIGITNFEHDVHGSDDIDNVDDFDDADDLDEVDDFDDDLDDFDDNWLFEVSVMEESVLPATGEEHRWFYE